MRPKTPQERRPPLTRHSKGRSDQVAIPRGGSTDALDKNDAAAVAENFTENGILVTPDGPIFGRESIEKYYVGVFKQVQLSDNLAPVDDDSPHIIGTAGNEMWATGKYSCTVKGQNFGPVAATGYWSVIREGDDWKIRMLTFNATPAPAK